MLSRPICAFAALAALALAHDPRAVPYEAVPGYTDCSRMDARSKHYVEKPECVVPAPPSASTVTIACVGDSITAGGWPQIMQS